LRRGCCGCAVAVLALLAVGAAFALFAWTQRPGPEDVRSEALTPLLAEAGPPPERGDETRAVEPARRAPGVLELSLEAGSFRVEPGEPGSELTVLAEYDIATHELTETTEASAGGTWISRVRFGPKGGLLGLLFAGERSEPRVTVRVPRDLPLVLRADVGKGQARLDLGGLSLEALSVQGGMGEIVVAFDEPTVEPLASFGLTTSMGQTTVHGLGNASPGRATLSHSMGQLTVDLGGAWQRGSDVEVRFRLGQAEVIVPEGAPVQVVNAHVDGGEVSRRGFVQGAEVEPSAAVRLDAAGSFGELLLRR
jgi:hypothetical protein